VKFSNTHLYGGSYDLVAYPRDVEESIFLLQKLGLSPKTIINEIKNILPQFSNIDFESEAKKLALGSDDQDVSINDAMLWDFIIFLLRSVNKYDSKERISWDPQEYNDTSQEHLDQQFNPDAINRYYRGFVGYSDIYPDIQEGSWPIKLFADIRLNPEYKRYLDKYLGNKWNRYNNFSANQELLNQLNISDEEWEKLSHYEKIMMISLFLNAVHSSGSVVMNHPSFQNVIESSSENPIFEE